MKIGFKVEGARVEPHAAVPTLLFRLRVEADEPVASVALRCQVQIEPRRRSYEPAEQDRLLELFGEPSRWGETQSRLLWSHLTQLVPSFVNHTEVDLVMPCSYDFEVAGAKYFHALDEGEIPLLFLFSGTVFLKAGQGMSVVPIPWDRESRYRLPVAVWRELMESYFPGGGWIRLSRESLDALQRFKAERALVSWDEALGELLGERV